MSRYPTRTVTVSGEIVPWLAAEGPLSYSPENPPVRDYYFQYGWVLPEVLKSDGDRRHHYFGVGVKDYADEVFAFWNEARAGRRTRVHLKIGNIGRSEVTAPIAVYLHRERAYRFRWCYMLVQHGSYQHVPREELKTEGIRPKKRTGLLGVGCADAGGGRPAGQFVRQQDDGVSLSSAVLNRVMELEFSAP